MNNHLPRKESRGYHLFFIYLLLVATSFLLVINLSDSLSGTPDSYSNQHARLVSGNVGGIFLLLSMVFHARGKYQVDADGLNMFLYRFFLALCAVTLLIQFWLGL